MRLLHSFVVALAAGAAQAASWGFDDATLAVTPKKASENGITKKFTEKSLPKSPIAFGSTDTLKLSLTTTENGKPKRPHQAFLILEDEATGLEAPFPLSVRESGKGSVEIKHADVPVPLLVSDVPIHARLIIASFGSSQGYNIPVFDVLIKLDQTVTPPSFEKPMRYGKRDEIHHIFRGDPKNPPKIVSLAFAAAVAATVPGLLIGWALLGGNVSHLPKALSAAPISHAVFFGSIIAMEFVFFLYYTSWNLFQVLPVIGLVGTTAFLSGTKALGEVQSRRLAGER